MLKLFFVSAFFVVTMFSQSNQSKCEPTKQSDWKFYELQGKVKKIITYKTLFIKNKKSNLLEGREPEFEEEINFDAQGNSIDYRDSIPRVAAGNSEIKFTVHYVCNSNNKIIAVKYTSKDGSSFDKTKYEYYSNGLLKERANYFSDGKLESKDFYKYDDKKNLVEQIETQQVHPEHFRPKRYDVYVTTKQTYKYDNKDNRVEEKSFYPNGSLYSTWLYIFDSKNRLIKHTRIDEKQRLVDQIIYKYVGKKVVEKLHYQNFCYQRDGSFCEGRVNSGEGWFYYLTKKVYEHDRKGNWVKKIELNMGGEENRKDFELEMIFKRTISYY